MVQHSATSKRRRRRRRRIKVFAYSFLSA